MTTLSSRDPSQRQVLVNLGNRYAVFGPSLGLPQATHFDPKTDSELLPRVADESDGAEERIAQTLCVPGMKKSAVVEGTSTADVELLDADGSRVFIDIKVRERDPKQREFEQEFLHLTEAAKIDQTLEVWYFNIERLKLTVMRLDPHGKMQFDKLVPLDVWENTAEGGVFRRDTVITRVDDWIHRVGNLYDDVRAWLKDQPLLSIDQTRTVTMSEEMMQKFAVSDREIHLLDVLKTDQVIASFVPRGPWIFGARGRIDIITRDRTLMLVALGDEGNEWRLVSTETRQRTEPFNKEALLALMGEP